MLRMEVAIPVKGLHKVRRRPHVQAAPCRLRCFGSLLTKLCDCTFVTGI